MMLTFILAMMAGLALLAWSSDRFVEGASSLARNLGVSPLVVGMVVVGFGTSAPEMLVSLMAAWEGSPSLALGNAAGSNITNIALILGVTALLTPVAVHSRVVKRELPIVLLVGALAWGLLADGRLSTVDGSVLLTVLMLVLAWMVRTAKVTPMETDALLQEIREEEPAALPMQPSLIWTAVGLVLLVLSSRLLVWGAVGVAQAWGVSDLVIGLTIVAVGTSLPELAASISSIRKGEADMAVGNVVGSNLFNTLAVMGIPAMLGEVAVPGGLLGRDLPVMLGLTVLLLLFNFTPPTRNLITRPEGGVLLALFVAYQVLLYVLTNQH